VNFLLFFEGRVGANIAFLFLLNSFLSCASTAMPNFLIVECGVDNTPLESALLEDGSETVSIQYGPSFIAQVREIRPDAVIFNLESPSEALLADLLALSRQSPLPVIMFAADGSSATIQKAIQSEVTSYEVNGLDGDRLPSIIQVALARFKHQQALKQALQEAKIQLEDRKQIDRAKAILINTRNFTENEAYHTLRKLAMDRNITLGQMARNVIAMAELLK
jgi:response regulator NasT